MAVDLHEMGGDSTYFFAPPAEPLNPHITRAQQEWHETFGRAIAARFDARASRTSSARSSTPSTPATARPGPSPTGSIGMTFEQASARGLVWRREDDTELTFLDGIHNHFRAALATVETAARGREKLLRDFLEFRRSAVGRGRDGAGARSTCSCRAPTRRASPASADAPGRAGDRGARGRGRSSRRAAATFPAGSIVVPLAQPAGRLVRNLLDPRISMDEAFLKEQERRRKKRLPDEIYDVTAWSLPLVFDVECVGHGRARRRDASVRPGGRGRRAALGAGEGRVAPALGLGHGGGGGRGGRRPG